MTPYQLVGRTCANYVKGGCIFNGPTWKEGECPLSSPGGRCSYFERAVLPLAERVPNYARVPASYWRGVAKKEGLSGVALEATAAIHAAKYLCECGEPREKGHRYCDKCAARRKRESAQRRKAKQRS